MESYKQADRQLSKTKSAPDHVIRAYINISIWQWHISTALLQSEDLHPFKAKMTHYYMQNKQKKKWCTDSYVSLFFKIYTISIYTNAVRFVTLVFLIKSTGEVYVVKALIYIFSSVQDLLTNLTSKHYVTGYFYACFHG